jgi:hypothetical protein
MVNKIGLLENLLEFVDHETPELCFMPEEDYRGASMKINRALSIMRRVYDEVKDQFPDEPVIRKIREHYDDSWDVRQPKSYEEMLESDP